MAEDKKVEQLNQVIESSSDPNSEQVEEHTIEQSVAQTEVSRTKKSILNVSYSLGFYFIKVLIGFILRKYTIGTLGTELTGMHTTVGNLLGYISLIELGVGTAISFLLYKPLVEKDYDTINEIISVQGWFYRKISYVFLVAAGILMLFFPRIFNDTTLPGWMPYVSCSVYLFSSILGYLYNYKIILLYADQKGYKIVAYSAITNIAFNLFQIGCLIWIKDAGRAFVAISVLNVLFALLGMFILKYVLDREYPWLKTNISQGRRLLDKHRIIITKSRQVMVHKLAGVLTGPTSQFIIFKLVSLSMVALYDNYMMLGISCYNLLTNFFNGLEAGIGSMVAEGDTKKVVRFFWELAGAYHFATSLVVAGLVAFTHEFIKLWIGDTMLLADSTLLLITLTIHLRITNYTGNFLVAYGLVQDVYAPLIESGINIACSLGLGYWFHSMGWLAIDGIIIGMNLSCIIIPFIWKPYFLFTQGFKLSPWMYFRNQIKYPLIIWVLGLPFGYYVRSLHLDYSNLLMLLGNMAWTMIIFTLVSFGIFYAISQGFRNITHRILTIVQKKLRKEAI